jgi:hypothetical protein
MSLALPLQTDEVRHEKLYDHIISAPPTLFECKFELLRKKPCQSRRRCIFARPGRLQVLFSCTRSEAKELLLAAISPLMGTEASHHACHTLSCAQVELRAPPRYWRGGNARPLASGLDRH